MMIYRETATTADKLVNLNINCELGQSLSCAISCFHCD